MCCPMVRCAVAPSAAGAACNNTNNRAWSTSVSCAARGYNERSGSAPRATLAPALPRRKQRVRLQLTDLLYPPPNHT